LKLRELQVAFFMVAKTYNNTDRYAGLLHEEHLCSIDLAILFMKVCIRPNFSVVQRSVTSIGLLNTINPVLLNLFPIHPVANTCPI